MNVKFFVCGLIVVILFIVVGAGDFLINDTLRAASYALYSSNKGVFYGLSIEMVFIIFIGFITSLGALITFGFSSTVFVYDRRNKY
jgi:hypothetical protein